MGLLIRLFSSAVALWIATLVLPGITVSTESTPKKIGVIVLVAAIFGVINAVLRPLIKMVGCAFYVFTLGLAALVVNGLLFMLTSWIAGQFDIPFHVDNFWPSAVVGALLVGVISWLLSLVIPDGD